MADPAQTPKVDVTSAPTSGGIETKPQIGSLHVADLDKSVSESVLYHFFRTRGFTIGSIRVCKDSATDISLGYAYANFHDRAEAQRAMDELNYTPIIPNGAPCRISWVERDPSKRKSGVGNLFIKNLDKEIDNEALYGAFGEYGKIISCKVAVDENNVSKGYGFVQFDREEDSEAAIAALSGKCFNGKPVYVGPFIPKAKRPSQESNFTNLYLKEIHPDITSEQFDILVRKITEDIGKITSPKLMVESVVDKDGVRVEKSRRFGFVNFENHDVAVKALERFKDDAKVKEIAPEFVAEGKQLYANRAIPKSQRTANGVQQQKQNLYIKNLHESIDDEKLRSIFAEFGKIGSAVVMRNPEGISKGFGFVCFDSPESAANAIRALHQAKKVEGKPLYVAFAQSKAYRKLHLTQLYQNRSVMPLPPQMMAYPPNPYPYQMRMGQPPMRGYRGGYRGRYAPNGPVPSQSPVHYTNQPQFENASPVAEAHIHAAADHLFKKLQEQYKGTNEVDIKRVVGRVLADTQSMPKEQALAYINEFIESPEKRESLDQLNSKKE